MSELERPAVGDELLMVNTHVKYTGGVRNAEHDVTRVEVTKVARYRFSVRREEGWVQEFDLRTGRGGGSDRSTGPRLFTEDGWKAHLRETAADDYLRASGVHPHQFRGTLLKAAVGRRVELANLIRRFEGLEEI